MKIEDRILVEEFKEELFDKSRTIISLPKFFKYFLKTLVPLWGDIKLYKAFKVEKLLVSKENKDKFYEILNKSIFGISVITKYSLYYFTYDILKQLLQH